MSSSSEHLPAAGIAGPRRASLLPILAVLVMGALLRLLRLDAQGLWFDETVLAAFSDLPLGQLRGFFERLGPFSPIAAAKAPLLVALMRLWIELCGTSEISLRLPAALLGLGSLALLYLLVSRLLGRSAALLASLLLAVNPFHIYYSQQLAEYSPLVFLALLSFLLWLPLYLCGPVRGGPARLRTLASVVLNVLVVLLHPLGLLVAGVQSLLLLCRLGRRALACGSLWLNGLLLVCGLAYFAFSASHAQAVQLTLGWIPAIGPGSVVELLRTFSHGGLVHGHLAREQPHWLQDMSLVLMSLFFVLGLFGLPRQDRAEAGRREPVRLLLLVWFFVPLAALLLCSMVLTDLWVPRYLSFILPAYLVLCAQGVLRLPDLLPLPRIARAVLPGLLLGLCTLPPLVLHYLPPSGSFRELSQVLRSGLRSADGIICTPDRIFLPFMYYFSHELGPSVLLGERLHERVEQNDRVVITDFHNPASRLERRADFGAWLEAKKRIWVVAVQDWPGDQQTAPLLDHLSRRFFRRRAWFFAYSGAELVLLERQEK